MAGPRNGAYLLYDLLLHCAGLLILPYVGLRSLLSRPFRKAVFGRLGFVDCDPHEQGGLLLHGVSVGEVRAMRPLVEALCAHCPETRLIVSSTTVSGRQTARKFYPDLRVVPYPVDLPSACRRFLARLRPRAVVLMELEIWPNFLRRCDEAGIPVAIVNGRITEKSMSGYRRVQRFLPQFDRVLLYGVQNERYAERFRNLAVPPERIRITGNLKYDNLPLPDESESVPEPWRTWVDGRAAVACGSTHAPEELALLVAASRDRRLDDVLFLVAPRHPVRAPRLLRELRDLREGLPGRRFVLRSEWPEDQPLPDGCVLIVDTFGELDAVYRVARLAFVGGSLLPHGGQNVLEPAAIGRPVLVGPHTENFVEEVELLARAGALERAENAAELIEWMAVWLAEPQRAVSVGKAALVALAEQRGAARTTFAALQQAGIVA